MILITGATGQLGSAVLGQLLARTEASEVAALVRDPGKATDLSARGVSVRVADYDDAAGLRQAMLGIDRVLLIPGTEPGERVQQHQNVIDAAAGAGVDLLGFASRSLRDIEGSRNGLMGDYVETEDRVRASGLRYVLFRNALYLDTLPLFVGGPSVFDSGAIRLPVGDGTGAYALRREMGEALANGILDHRGGDHTYVVAAPEAYSFDDVAAALTEIAGRPVTYTAVTDEEWVAGAVQRGLPEAMARRSVGFFADIRDHQLDETSDDLTTLLGRKPTDLTAGLRELFSR